METIAVKDFHHDMANHGFAVVNDIYTRDEIADLLLEIDKADTGNATFRKSDDLFAIRQFLKEIPAVHPIIFNEKLKAIITATFGAGYFVAKAIYFDKPSTSNWFVAWHQDLTLSVANKTEVAGYGPWTARQNQFAVQPPLTILERNFTVRIHLDDTDEGNGALKVIPGSHLKGVYRAETINWDEEMEFTCSVEAGGVMFMRPLLMHASNRTTNNRPRKVIHIELSDATLPKEINWLEKAVIF